MFWVPRVCPHIPIFLLILFYQIVAFHQSGHHAVGFGLVVGVYGSLIFYAEVIFGMICVVCDASFFCLGTY